MPTPPSSSSPASHSTPGFNTMSRSTPPPPYRPTSPLELRDPASAASTSSSPSSSRRMNPSPIINDHPERSVASSFRSQSGSSSSSSTQQTFSPLSVYPTPDLSTAPTSPAQSSTPITRSWRPTPNVPQHINRRHRRVGSDGEEANRWLSEDEGIGSSSSGGVQRRRSAGARNRRRRDIDRADGHDRDGDAGPSTLAHRARGTDKVNTTEQAIAALNESKRLTSAIPARPHPLRMSSFDGHQQRTTRKSPDISPSRAVGADPPQIEQLIPPPIASDVNVGLGLSVQGAGPIPMMPVGDIPQNDNTLSAIRPAGVVPDFASGRGGDGIGGLNLPVAGVRPDDVDSAVSQLEKRKDMVDKLGRILGCALCPSVDGVAPLLHRPITLPCGHTLSASHIHIPSPPPIHFTNEPPHEIFAAQERQHQQRLSIWANVMCPIPTCKRFSPTASASSVFSNAAVSDMGPLPLDSRDGAGSELHRTGTLGSGVHYYPPTPTPATMPAPPPAYSSETPTSTSGSPLLDVCVDRILSIVQRERKRLESDVEETAGVEETDVESLNSSDEDEEVQPRPSSNLHTSLTSDFSHLTPSALGSSSLMGRTGSKRRRGDHRAAKRLPRANLNLDQSNDGGFEKELLSTLECDVCAMLLYEPVTTPCQHSFCSKCLSRSLDHSSRCPVCRQDLPSFAFFQDHAVNKVLLTIIKTAFPEEYIERQQSIERDERDARLDTPIFVCTLAFPGMPTILHVFEPRYRLMIRRCIESPSPRFGMVLPAKGTGAPQLQGLQEYGTMLEIQSVQMLPDGRSMVETVGTHRFKLLEKGSLDGYTVGRIERIDDVSPEEEIAMEREAVSRAATMSRANPIPPLPSTSSSSVTGPNVMATTSMDSANDSSINVTSGQVSVPPLPVQQPMVQPALPAVQSGGLPLLTSGSVDFAALASQASAPGSSNNANAVDDTPETTDELMAICQAFIDQLRSGSAPWLLQRLNNTYGSMPTDPSEFSYWMALVMPIDEYEKARLLPIRSPRLRLKLIVHWVESLRSSWWFSSGCVVG